MKKVMNKKGFTLVELLMVVIIIGILVTIAVPSYYKSIERAKGGKAKTTLRTITNAQVQYRALNDEYTVNLADLSTVDLPAQIIANADNDWTFACVGDESTLTTTATRDGGPYDTQAVTMDQDGEYLNPGPEEWN